MSEQEKTSCLWCGARGVDFDESPRPSVHCDHPTPAPIDYWKALNRMAGHVANGSERTVKLFQDDATNTCHLVLGTDSISQKAKSYYGGSFEDVVCQAIDAGEAEED